MDLEIIKKAEYAVSPEEMMLDKAQLLGLTAPEMTVLIGGLRSIGISSSDHGILTKNPGTLTNDFFVNILDPNIEWKKLDQNSFAGIDINSNEKIANATRFDLVFGSNSQLRAIAEVYASDDGHDKFINDFITAWNKVMNLDRFDLS